jgi:hypothetical protein
MLVMQLGVIAAVLLGITDNQGIIYALTIPLATYAVGVPLGLVLAVIGFFQPNRKRTYAKLGSCLSLAGPILFLLFLLVITSFR